MKTNTVLRWFNNSKLPMQINSGSLYYNYALRLKERGDLIVEASPHGIRVLEVTEKGKEKCKK